MRRTSEPIESNERPTTPKVPSVATRARSTANSQSVARITGILELLAPDTAGETLTGELAPSDWTEIRVG